MFAALKRMEEKRSRMTLLATCFLVGKWTRVGDACVTR